MQPDNPASELPSKLSNFLSCLADEWDSFDGSLERIVADWLWSASYRDELLNELDELLLRSSLPVPELVHAGNLHLTSQDKTREFLISFRAALEKTSPEGP